MSQQAIRSKEDPGSCSGVRLSPPQIQMIEEALTTVGDFGEVHLVVQKGRLRFVVIQKSLDALKWRPAAADQA